MTSNPPGPARAASDSDDILRRFTFLAGAGELLASSLDYERTLEEIARLAVPMLGDLCIVDVVEEETLRRVATTHVLGAKGALLEELRRRYPPSENSPHPASRVMQSGTLELLRVVTPDVVASHTKSADHAQLIRDIGIRSHLAVPLVARGHIVGVLSLGITESDRQYTDADVGFAQEVARLAALAVDNARLYQAARVSEGRFRAIMEQSPLSTQIFAADGRTLRVNRAWETLWGVTLERLGGYNILQDPQLEERGIAPLIRRAFAGEAVELPAIRYDPNETVPDKSDHRDPVRWVRAFAYPIRDVNGAVLEVVLVHEDITDTYRANEKLRHSEERLRLALTAGRMNVWHWDLHTDVVECSDNAREFWGMDIGRASDFMRVVHPDDAHGVIQAAREAMAGEGPYMAEYRLRAQHGVVRWVQSRGRMERDDNGHPRNIVGVTVDITDLKLAEQQLREEDRRKDEFLATLAHELRNPLAPIRTGLALLRASTDASALQRTREIMERQLAHMVRLIDDLLDLSRVTRGKVAIEKERVDLWSVLGSAIEASRPLIDAASVQLHVRVPEGPIPIDADRTRLSQVLSNLLNNAAKFTEPGGRIELEAVADADTVTISVKDTGIGIPPEMLSRIFEMFAQIADSRARGQSGLGIGLTLVRRLVELHGGQVWAESDGPSTGSTFYVKLPLATAVAADLTTQSAPVPERTGHVRRVLVVDDNVDAAEMLAAFLSLDGHDVRTANSGPAAIEIAREFRPQFAFLDIGMPGMNGYELAQLLRAERSLEGLTLVALTGWGQEEDRRQSRDAGLDHHLTKPVDPREVQALVRDRAQR
jgi:PAS domain S-box-containing protein